MTKLISKKKDVSFVFDFEFEVNFAKNPSTNW